MKLGIFLISLACCLYLTTARPNSSDYDGSKEKSQTAEVENSKNEELNYEYSPSDTKHTQNGATDRNGKKPLHELAELLYSDYNVSKSTMIESLEQIKNVEITMLNKSTEMYKHICDYVNNTSGDNKRSKADEIFEVIRHEDQNRYKPYERNFNRQLLFHGTPRRNLVGILKNGLKNSPSEAKFTGSSFGRGIYFSDSIIMSAPYSDNVYGIVLLCEVALGVVDIRYKRDDSKLKEHCDSVQALGENYPHPVHVQPDGLQIPNGMFALRNVTTGIQFNEFVVSDEARVKIRYIVKLKSN